MGVAPVTFPGGGAGLLALELYHPIQGCAVESTEKEGKCQGKEFAQFANWAFRSQKAVFARKMRSGGKLPKVIAAPRERYARTGFEPR